MNESDWSNLLVQVAELQGAAARCEFLLHAIAIVAAILLGFALVAAMLWGLGRGRIWLLVAVIAAPSASRAADVEVYFPFGKYPFGFGEIAEGVGWETAAGSMVFYQNEEPFESTDGGFWNFEFRGTGLFTWGFSPGISSGGWQPTSAEVDAALCALTEDYAGALRCAMQAYRAENWLRWFAAVKFPGDPNDALGDFDGCGLCSGPPTDTDGDGIPDNEDTDDDGDGIPDDEDPCPLDEENECEEGMLDTDGDGMPDWMDDDDDGDGVADEDDVCPLDADDECEECEGVDSDNDGCNDCIDPRPNIASGSDCPTNPGCTESPGCQNTYMREPNCDCDGDGCPNARDPAPLDPDVGCTDDENDCGCENQWEKKKKKFETKMQKRGWSLRWIQNIEENADPFAITVPVPGVWGFDGWATYTCHIPLNFSGWGGQYPGIAQAMEYLRTFCRYFLVAVFAFRVFGWVMKDLARD